MNATVNKHPCHNCGGEMQWNAAKQALVCPFCGTQADWAPAQVEAGGIVEHDLGSALSGVQPAMAAQQREVQCQNCNAITVFSAERVAQRCDFCGSPKIIEVAAQSDAFVPESLLPFKISDGQVRDLIRRWYQTRWFAPNRLKTAALTDTLHGVYLPYWTFDAHADARWTAEAGYHYHVTVNGKSERRTRWEHASGALQHHFDDDLVPASTGIHAKLLSGIEPFPTTTDLKLYSPEFVRGWTVERYQIDLRAAAETNMAQMQAALRRLCAEQVPGDTHRNLDVQAQYSDRRFKHVLMPVWLVSYTYGSRNFQVVANGYTGAIDGERPYSWIKIFFAVVTALIVLGTLFYLLEGQ